MLMWDFESESLNKTKKLNQFLRETIATRKTCWLSGRYCYKWAKSKSERIIGFRFVLVGVAVGKGVVGLKLGLVVGTLVGLIVGAEVGEIVGCFVSEQSN